MRLPTSLLSLALAACTGCTRPATAQSPTPAPRIGVAAFGSVDPIAHAGLLQRLGFDYLEPALSKLAALPDAEIAALHERLRGAGIAIEAMNWFLPGGDPGVVYLAEQREPVRRRVALKLIKLGMDRAATAARCAPPAARSRRP